MKAYSYHLRKNMSAKEIITQIWDIHFGPEGMDPTCPYLRDKIPVAIHPFSGKHLETTIQTFFKVPIPETAYHMQLFAKNLGRPLEFEELYLFTRLASGFDGSVFDITAYSQKGFRRFKVKSIVDGLWEYGSVIGMDRSTERQISNELTTGNPFEAPELRISMSRLIRNVAQYRNERAKWSKMKSESEFVKFIADMLRLEAFAPSMTYSKDWEYQELPFLVPNIMERVWVFDPIHFPEKPAMIFPTTGVCFSLLQAINLLQRWKYDGIVYISNDQSSEKFAWTLRDYSKTSGLLFQHIHFPEDPLDIDLRKRTICFINEKIVQKLTSVCNFPNSFVVPVTVRGTKW